MKWPSTRYWTVNGGAREECSHRFGCYCFRSDADSVRRAVGAACVRQAVIPINSVAVAAVTCFRESRTWSSDCHTRRIDDSVAGN